MPSLSFSSWQQRDGHDDVRDAWLASEKFKAECNWNHVPGTCGLCGSRDGFVLARGADRERPDPRENLLCAACHANSRVRAALRLMLDHLDALDHPPAVYLTEQVTGTFVWLQNHLHGMLHGSEFEPSFLKRKALTRRLRQAGGRGSVAFQDVTRLRFPDASLDDIATFDVLEHVPDYQAAVRQFARTLRPGGACIATFPFLDSPHTVVRARVDGDGTIQHLLEPEYHGDPISGGVLCFYHFGWDVLDVFRDAGFSEVSMVMPCGAERGLLYGLWTLVGIR